MKKRNRRLVADALRHQAALEEQVTFNLAGKEGKRTEWIEARGAARALRDFAERIDYFVGAATPSAGRCPGCGLTVVVEP